MLPKSTTEFAASEKPGKITTAGGSGSIMDDAPLFAGLHDYNLRQAVRKNIEPAKERPIKEVKKAAKVQVKASTTGAPKAQVVPARAKTPTHNPDALLLSVTEMCTLLRISRATLVRMDKSGQLPGRMKLGGSVRFHRETVETWLQSLITTRVLP